VYAQHRDRALNSPIQTDCVLQRNAHGHAVIVTRLKGGLGNQMFQYAFGKALALQTGSPLAIDLSFLSRNQVSQGAFVARPYLLGGFPEIRDRTTHIEPSLVPRQLRRLWGHVWHPQLKVVRETSLRFDATHFALHPPVLLDGYWQDEQYFAAQADAIRAAFTFPPLRDDPRNQHHLDAIRAASCAVAVHVRRGDYLFDGISRSHGLCSPEYYRRAFRVMDERQIGATYFFFSDDPTWVRDALAPALERSVVVDGNAERPVRDLQLMSACSHHIIANSSFSWWGAWLGGSSLQTVIAPARWYADAGLESQARDICPARWLRLEDR
jgi:hypothetical protein